MQKKLDRFFKNITSPFLDRYHKWYHKKTRVFSFNGLQVNVIPGVYSPINSNTTLGLLRYFSEVDLQHKTFLELGCGTGILSVLADSNGALVTASDVNEVAIKELSVRVREDNLGIISVYSDLFENLHFHFDFIVINPPYLCENPSSVTEMGIKCGSNFEYFERLFLQLRIRGVRESMVVLALSEEAELFSICRRAKQNHLKLETLEVMHVKGERVVIYHVIED